MPMTQRNAKRYGAQPKPKPGHGPDTALATAHAALNALEAALRALPTSDDLIDATIRLRQQLIRTLSQPPSEAET
jgi:hypothetical protein